MTFAPHRTEVVECGSNRWQHKDRIEEGDKILVIIDDRLNFKERVKYIGEKAFVTTGALARMIPNIVHSKGGEFWR